MPKSSLLVLLLLAIACGADSNRQASPLSKDPISVRGWIADVEGAPKAAYSTIETEQVRKLQLFQQTSVTVDNAPYVSGGVAENGSFVLLDVPPGNVSIVFTAPGAPQARLVLQRIPGNADVLVPALLLRKDGVALLQPAAVKVRMAAKIDKAVPSGATALVAGVTLPVTNTPISQMTDRRDFPNPGGPAPLAVVR